MAKAPAGPVLGIDLGGTKILTAVVDAGGKVVSRDRCDTPAAAGHEAGTAAILGSAARSIAQAGIDPAELSAVGIGAPGVSNPETGILHTSPNLPGWRDVPLRDMIQAKLGGGVFLINDANAAAAGELYYGAARAARNFVYITVSTGIGGGIVTDGRIYTGATGGAGELGHMSIVEDGPPCACGSRGCWETLASGTALARLARERIGAGAKTSVLEYAGSVEGINAEAIHRAVQEGDALAKELLSRVAYYLGVGLANIINIFNPELIVIGGGLVNIGEMLLEPAWQEAGRRAFPPSFQVVRLARAELGGDAGVIGAAAYARQKALEAGV